MKLGIVTDEQYELEKSRTPIVRSTADAVSNGQISDGEIVEESHRGRKPGDKNVPESIRKLIADDALMNGRQSAIQLAKDFKISPSSVSAYSVGATSTKSYHKPEDTLTNYLKMRRNRITKKSLRVLTASLDQLTPDKLNGVKPRDLAAIAKDMSTISNNMTPPDNANDGAQRPQFVVYAPQVRDERTYETIIVNDNY